MDFFSRTDRSDAVIFGTPLLAMAAFMGYFGVRGLILFIRGSREAPADPLAFGIGIASALGLCYVVARLWRHNDPRPLLPTPFLLFGSLAVLGGMVWMMVLNYEVGGGVLSNLRVIIVPGAIGLLGLRLWHRRVTRTSNSPESDAT